MENYLAIGPNYWGKGTTKAEAKKQLVRAGGSLETFILYRAPKGATELWVDDFGNCRWTWAPETTEAEREGQMEQLEAHGLQS